jgi:hypothetical protein
MTAFERVPFTKHHVAFGTGIDYWTSGGKIHVSKKDDPSHFAQRIMTLLKNRDYIFEETEDGLCVVPKMIPCKDDGESEEKEKDPS